MASFLEGWRPAITEAFHSSLSWRNECNRHAQEKFLSFLVWDSPWALNSLWLSEFHTTGPLTQRVQHWMLGKPRFAWPKASEGKEGENLSLNWKRLLIKAVVLVRIIERMTGTCTYLYGEPVLLLNLLYEKFLRVKWAKWRCGHRITINGTLWCRR